MEVSEAVLKMQERAAEIAFEREAKREKRCDVCGEPLTEEQEKAEVVRKNDPLFETVYSRHLVVHEPCFDREKMVMA